MSANEDKLKRVYAQLISLQDNLPKTHPNNKMEWDDVRLYNELLEKLESLGMNVGDFKIESSMLTDEIILTNYLSRETAASGRSNVRCGYFKIKLDALLTYSQLNEKKTKMGFHDPEKE